MLPEQPVRAQIGSDPAALPPIRSSARVSRRAFLLGLALALLMCAVMLYLDSFVGATYLSGNFLPIGAIGAVLLLPLFLGFILGDCANALLWTVIGYTLLPG